MTETAIANQKLEFNRGNLADENLISNIIDCFYPKILDDYRINRYFYTRTIDEQTKPLKLLINALLNENGVSPKQISELADDFFTAAFAKGNAKPSLVNNRDFAFLEMFVTGDIVGGEHESELVLLCPAHSHLLRLQPNEDNYDVVLENLANTLKELNIADKLASEILAFAATGRDSILGRGNAIYNEDDASTRFRTHG
jgi:truncated hemoglobin YjbI